MMFSHGILRIVKWAFFILVAAYIVLVIARVFQMFEADKTEIQVAKIYATKLTLADVMGENLPPDPGTEADKTIAGIDANENGIRDDVELAIFREYPNSAKTRAVLLQYALVLQMQMTLPIINMQTVIATVEKKSQANRCMWYFKDIKEKEKYVDELQINTGERNKYLDEFYTNLGSYSASKLGCDIDLSTL